MQWRNDTAEDMRETGGHEHWVPACIAHARMTSRRSDCAVDSSVILSSWQNCQRFASVSLFGTKTNVISLFKIYIYIFIYIIFICYICTWNLLYKVLFSYLRQISFFTLVWTSYNKEFHTFGNQIRNASHKCSEIITFTNNVCWQTDHKEKKTWVSVTRFTFSELFQISS
jgi:hypothetical protein